MRESSGLRAWAQRGLTWSGLFPLGAYLLLHAWVVLHVAQGPQATTHVFASLADQTAWRWFVRLGVWAPLALHVVLALVLVSVRATRSNESLQVRGLMRLTGILTALYVVLHTQEIVRPRADGRVLANEIHHHLQTRWDTSTGHATQVIGLVSVVVHFALGVWQVLVRDWVQRETTRRLVSVVMVVLGIALLAMYLEPVWHITTRCGGLWLRAREGCVATEP